MSSTILCCPECGTQYPWQARFANEVIQCKKCGVCLGMPADATGEVKRVDDEATSVEGDVLVDDEYRRAPEPNNEKPTSVTNCPGCASPLATTAVLCISCGYDTRTKSKVNLVSAKGDDAIANEEVPQAKDVLSVLLRGEVLAGAVRLGFIFMATLVLSFLLAFVTAVPMGWLVGWEKIAKIAGVAVVAVACGVMAWSSKRLCWVVRFHESGEPDEIPSMLAMSQRSAFALMFALFPAITAASIGSIITLVGAPDALMGILFGAAFLFTIPLSFAYYFAYDEPEHLTPLALLRATFPLYCLLLVYGAAWTLCVWLLPILALLLVVYFDAMMTDWMMLVVLLFGGATCTSMYGVLAITGMLLKRYRLEKQRKPGEVRACLGRVAVAGVVVAVAAIAIAVPTFSVAQHRTQANRLKKEHELAAEADKLREQQQSEADRVAAAERKAQEELEAKLAEEDRQRREVEAVVQARARRLAALDEDWESFRPEVVADPLEQTPLTPGQSIDRWPDVNLMYLPGGQIALKSTDPIVRSNPATPTESEARLRFPRGILMSQPVSPAAYRTIMGVVPAGGEDDKAMALNVTADEARDFCQRLGEIQGRAYRLPYEAEWLYACHLAHKYGDRVALGEIPSSEWVVPHDPLLAGKEIHRDWSPASGDLVARAGFGGPTKATTRMEEPQQASFRIVEDLNDAAPTPDRSLWLRPVAQWQIDYLIPNPEYSETEPLRWHRSEPTCLANPVISRGLFTAVRIDLRDGSAKPVPFVKDRCCTLSPDGRSCLLYQGAIKDSVVGVRHPPDRPVRFSLVDQKPLEPTGELPPLKWRSRINVIDRGCQWGLNCYGQLFDLQTGEEVSHLDESISEEATEREVSQFAVVNATFAPNSRHIVLVPRGGNKDRIPPCLITLDASGKVANRVRLEKTAMDSSLKGYPWPQTAAFSPDSKYLTLCYVDGPTLVVDVATGKAVASFKLPAKHSSWSPDGRFIVLSAFRKIHIISTRTWQVLTSITLEPGHGRSSLSGLSLNATYISADGRYLAAFMVGGADKGKSKIKVWYGWQRALNK